ncbi:MAG TPA: endonuclease/exonuclease/phosphatase family protein [Verrucomicrobiae bacterium]|nr:endonuclease/exonuclease/phosphatase family protein [Verrucomicrobiae bacterium]
MSLEKHASPDNAPAVKFKVSTAFFIFGLLCNFSSVAGAFRIATYNAENYLDTPTETRHFTKSAKAKAKVCESISAINPDVLAVQEMGTTNALMELRAALKSEGQYFPFWEFVEGADTNIHVAILSKFPIISRHPHTDDEFLLDGKRFRVSRGFVEVEIQPTTNFTFTLVAAHLKSRLNDTAADPSEQRLNEAKILRRILDEHFRKNPKAKIVVLGDLNDAPDSESVRTIIGRGKFKLIDTRPADRNGDDSPALPPYFHPPRVAWTYYFGKDDTYSRIDYILLSPAMARVWVMNETYALTISNWGVGSDHRPIVAAFEK